jgi:hypothetical protein
VLAVTPDQRTGSVTVTFAAPGSDGGLPITEYHVRCREVAGAEAKGATSPLVWAGVMLPLGQDLTFEVVAVNALGEGPPSEPSQQVQLQAELEVIRQALGAARGKLRQAPQARRVGALELEVARAEDEAEGDKRQVCVRR